MKRYQFEPESRLEGWSEDAQAAMTANPNYFVWWDQRKTALLIVLSIVLVYQVSKSRPRRRSR